MALTPAQTFAYGSTLLRFKIKSNVPFKRSRDEAKGYEVNVFPMDEMPDFTFKDSSVVESWSYGTHEIYDEVVRDLVRIKGASFF